jgi:hypothetical protein
MAVANPIPELVPVTTMVDIDFLSESAAHEANVAREASRSLLMLAPD